MFILSVAYTHTPKSRTDCLIYLKVGDFLLTTAFELSEKLFLFAGISDVNAKQTC